VARHRSPLTGTGTTVLVAAALLYVAAALLGYRTLAAAAVGLLALVALAALWVLVRPRVSLRRSVSPDRVVAGDQALGRIDVHNRSRLPSVPFVAVDRIGADAVELAVGTLGAGTRRPVFYAIPATRRGRVRLGPLTVERRDPLGLLRYARRVTTDDVLWVHPRIHPATTLPVGLVLDYEGRASDARPGTVTFSSLRDYVPGDDPRRIHWRTTARVGHLVVREHIDTTEPTTTVVLDNAGLTDADAFEHAVEVAASVYRAVEITGRPVRLDIVEPVRADDVHTPMDELAAVQAGAGEPGAVLAAVRRIPSGGVLVVVTGTDAGVAARLAEQRHRFNPVVVIQLRSAAAGPPEGTHRRPGMAVLCAATAAQAVRRWNRVAGGQSE
jgi:uncharacterized protein (DUF58 family)